MATYSLLWLPSLPSVLPSLLHTATLLYMSTYSLHYNSPALCCFVYVAYLAYLCYCLLCLPIANSIPCLVYMAIQSAMPK